MFKLFSENKNPLKLQTFFRRHNPANVHDRGWLVGWQDGLAFGWTKVSKKDFFNIFFKSLLNLGIFDLMWVLISGRTLSGSFQQIMSNAFNRGKRRLLHISSPSMKIKEEYECLILFLARWSGSVNKWTENIDICVCIQILICSVQSQSKDMVWTTLLGPNLS